jgi:long-subunit fatty acid transport protein
MNSQNNSATISYIRSAFPSIQQVAGPVVANIFSLSATQNLDQQWQLAETVNYAHGSSSGGNALNSINYNSYAASVDVYYWVTQFWSTALSYDYMKYNFDSGGAPGQVWARHAVTFSVRVFWE